jgi:hypothetical protein
VCLEGAAPTEAPPPEPLAEAGWRGAAAVPSRCFGNLSTIGAPWVYLPADGALLRFDSRFVRAQRFDLVKQGGPTTGGW